MESLTDKPLSEDELAHLDAHWRAANYLAVGQIYLMANPLLREPLAPEHIKPRLLGHWGTTPGLNILYTHLSRLIARDELDMMFVIGPGHGGPAIHANCWLEGTYSEVYRDIPRDERGMARLFRQFSFPGGVPSHVAPEIPGSIHEGGELGYSLTHAFGAAFDNPDLVVACVVGDGEAETGPLATSWHSNKFLDPVRDGAVLPILHLNGYKIANPTVLARISEDELTRFFEGHGWTPYLVAGDDPRSSTSSWPRRSTARWPRSGDCNARRGSRATATRPRWPMIVLRTPKGWTGPAFVDGLPVEGTWRAHQVPLAEVRTNPEHLAMLEAWMRSYRPGRAVRRRRCSAAVRHRLDAEGRAAHVREPARERRRVAARSRSPRLPRLRRGDRAQRSRPKRKRRAGSAASSATCSAPTNRSSNFRLFGPDETASNRLDAVYEATDKVWQGEILPVDEHLSRHGRVMEILSEHTCEGWLEGYLLTGRHGFFSCYEAFTHIIDSMFNQHAKWLETARKLEWRRSISSLNYLLTSHVWRQDHNGFTHQDPGFLDVVVNKKASVVRDLPAARRELPALGRRPLPAAPATTST